MNRLSRDGCWRSCRRVYCSVYSSLGVFFVLYFCFLVCVSLSSEFRFSQSFSFRFTDLVSTSDPLHRFNVQHTMNRPRPRPDTTLHDIDSKASRPVSQDSGRGPIRITYSAHRIGNRFQVSSVASGPAGVPGRVRATPSCRVATAGLLRKRSEFASSLGRKCSSSASVPLDSAVCVWRRLRRHVSHITWTLQQRCSETP
jgi:hypothetical protein